MCRQFENLDERKVNSPARVKGIHVSGSQPPNHERSNKQEQKRSESDDRKRVANPPLHGRFENIGWRDFAVTEESQHSDECTDDRSA